MMSIPDSWHVRLHALLARPCFMWIALAAAHSQRLLPVASLQHRCDAMCTYDAGREHDTSEAPSG